MVQASARMRWVLVSHLVSASSAAAPVEISAGKAPTPSATLGTSTIERSIYLTGAGTSGSAGLPAAGPRTIYLNPGVYTWGFSLDGPVDWGYAAKVYVPGGWYNWRCYVHGKGSPGAYGTDCLLDPHAAGQPNLWLPAAGQLAVVITSGTYAWRSWLIQ
jgi:hypothetical protein